MRRVTWMTPGFLSYHSWQYVEGLERPGRHPWQCVEGLDRHPWQCVEGLNRHPGGDATSLVITK